MPRELPELAGQSMGSAAHKIIRPDGSEATIERAINIDDFCGTLPGGGAAEAEQHTVLICFYRQEGAHAVAAVEAIALTDERFTEKTPICTVNVNEIVERTQRGQSFLSRLNRLYDVNPSLLRDLILQQAQV